MDWLAVVAVKFQMMFLGKAEINRETSASLRFIPAHPNGFPVYFPALSA
ncbi:MAG: hypothetical protein Pg6C_08730 [Treponemataceae bacterium]|nr:MAG: hypothetical protein Pg6C_08730 [Treponemataceae bacterium]